MRRWPSIGSAVLAVLVFGLWTMSAFRGAHSALEDAEQAVRSGESTPFKQLVLDAPDSRWTLLPAAFDLFDAASFAGDFWLAGAGGVARYGSNGTLKRTYRIGLDLPPAPVIRLASGLDPHSSRPVLFAATAGEGLLLFRPGGGVEQIRPEDAAARRLTDVLALATGRVLLATAHAGVLVWNGETLAPLHPELAGVHSTALAGSEEELWIGTLDEGLIAWSGGELQRFGESDGLPDPHIASLSVADGAVYAGTPLGVAEVRNGAFERTVAEGLFVTSTLVDDDTLWAGSFDEGVAELPLERRRPRLTPGVALDGPLSTRRLMQQGDVVFALAPDGLYERSPEGGGWRLALEAPPATLTARNISALHSDSRGRLWVGFFDRGLDLVEPGESLTTHVEDDDIFCVNRVVEDRKQNVFAVATANGLAVFSSDGRKTRTLRRRDGLIADHVTDVVVAPKGWIAATSAGVTFLDADGPRSVYALQGLVNNHVYTIAASGPRLLVGTLGGLSVLEGGVPHAGYTAAGSQLAHNWINAVVPYGDGFFIGEYGGGVQHLSSDGDWRSFPALAGVEINPNAMVADGDRAYAGTLDRGLLVYDREDDWSFTTDGLPSHNVTALTLANGVLYVGTDNGLTRIATEDLSR